ncbi:MAG: hypothetical protein HOP29_20175 [Phycisphaerales bacterium]|nr:hypothetical protein [Phycisphaerales bacterium]
MVRIAWIVAACGLLSSACTIEMCEPADFLNACPANIDPVANAGPDQAVAVGDFVLLDGSFSTDEDVITCCAEPNDLIIRMGGEVRTYRWVQTTGDAVDLEGPDSVTPSFTAPATPGERTFELTVTDDRGGTNTDQVTITIAAPDAAGGGSAESGG